jgi:protein-S-isoprenylcysteine O-methyltransferase Ste14
MRIKELVGSGDKVALLTLPFLVAGVAANVAVPSAFSVGGPPDLLRIISIVVLGLGIVTWIWSAVLILTKVPRHELITGGPFALVRHPLYTGVALLVVPWIGFLLNTWLGVLIGLVMYLGSRWFSPAEEASLSREFGPAWEDYRARVKAPWL